MVGIAVWGRMYGNREFGGEPGSLLLHIIVVPCRPSHSVWTLVLQRWIKCWFPNLGIQDTADTRTEQRATHETKNVKRVVLFPLYFIAWFTVVPAQFESGFFQLNPSDCTVSKLRRSFCIVAIQNGFWSLVHQIVLVWKKVVGLETNQLELRVVDCVLSAKETFFRKENGKSV